MKNWIDNIKWTQDGLVPIVVQDYISNKVIMFAWMNRLSLEASIKEKKAIYWSRSRKKIWTKGESSGHYQYIEDMYHHHLDEPRAHPRFCHKVFLGPYQAILVSCS